jgi:polyisoprenoid-binding protein YceI
MSKLYSILMKNLLVISTLLILASACNTEKKTAETGEAIATDKVATIQATSYTVDVAASSVGWTGSEGFAFNLKHAHNGTLNITKGNLLSTDTTLFGSFEIDIKSLKVLDIKKESSNKKLTNHLLGADFFETDKFPTANFEIVSAQPTHADSSKVVGNLTLKGVTKSVAIPAKIVKTDSTLTASAKFYINRKDWGMHYRSEDSFGDEMIRSEILIELNIFAKK